MEETGARSGDETELPSSAVSTDKSFASEDESVEGTKKRAGDDDETRADETKKVKLEVAEPEVAPAVSAVGVDATPSSSTNATAAEVKQEVPVAAATTPTVAPSAPPQKKKPTVKRQPTSSATPISASASASSTTPTVLAASTGVAPTQYSPSPTVPDSHPHTLEEETPEEIAKQYKKFSSSPKFNLNSEEVFCICRKPDHGGLLMISCDGCDEWFHFTCMRLNMQYKNLIAKFFCKFCKWKGTGETQWKRKCRVPSCFEPISMEGNSKYCSEQCGLDYIRGALLGARAAVASSATENAAAAASTVETAAKAAAPVNLTPAEIKSILLYTNTPTQEDPHKALTTLGSRFPQLASVAAFQTDPSVLKTFPASVVAAISAVDEKTARIQELLRIYRVKMDYLAKSREKLKLANEKLTEGDPAGDAAANAASSAATTTATSSSRSKKSKSGKPKKVEICGYDKIFSLDQEAWIAHYNAHSDELTRIIDPATTTAALQATIDPLVSYYYSRDDDSHTWFNGSICINDKRKCARHGGWWSLVQEEISKKSTELHADLRTLERERSAILREYSIHIFETQTVSA